MKNTNRFADLAMTYVTTDLYEKDYNVLRSVFSEHMKYDLVAEKDGHFFRIQVKYSSTGTASSATSTNRGMVKYTQEDFDYYAMYLPSVKKVIYVPITMAGVSIATSEPESSASVWWYEDFLDLKPFHEKRFIKGEFKPKPWLRKRGEWPEKETLERLVWEKPAEEIAKEFGVSGRMVGKWCESYGIQKPPRGYWSGKKWGRPGNRTLSGVPQTPALTN